MPRLLRRGAEFHEDGTDVVEALDRQMRRADTRHLLGHDDLFVQCRAHAAVFLWPVRRDPAFARQGAIPGQHFFRWRPRRAPAQRSREIRLQPRASIGAKLSFGGGVTTEHGQYLDEGLAAAGEENSAKPLSRWIIDRYCIVMCAFWTIEVHRARSALSILSRSCGEPILISAPRAASRWRVSGTASAW